MIQSFEFSPFSENTYVLIDDATNEAVVIDPGCYDQIEKETLARFIDERNLKLKAILLTHAHLDHVFGVAYLKRRYNVKAYLHEKDQPVYDDVPTRCMVYGLRGYEHSTVDGYLKEGESIKFGNVTLDVEFTPGHAPGHVVFINQAERYVVGGDVLFRKSIGRTDLPLGNHNELINSIRTKLFTLPDDYVVYPGHMDSTTIGYEKRNNPYL